MTTSSGLYVDQRRPEINSSAELKIPVGGVRKRLIDIVLSVILLVALSPLFFFVALLIKLFDGGPVLFVQKRVGFLSRQFPCLKFRTMTVDAEERLNSCLLNQSFSREWLTKRKLISDPRITRIGSFLRKTSIDELPQLVNVIRGEMSLVGPRPIVWDELANYGPDAGFYLSVRPGLTGEWQVGGRSNTSYDTRVNIDKEYCLHWSILRDLIIIIRTVPAVILGRGSC